MMAKLLLWVFISLLSTSGRLDSHCKLSKDFWRFSVGTQKSLTSVVTSTSKFRTVYLSLGALPCSCLHRRFVQLFTNFCKAILELITMSMSSGYTKGLSISSRLLVLNETCPCSDPKTVPLLIFLKSEQQNPICFLHFKSSSVHKTTFL